MKKSFKSLACMITLLATSSLIMNTTVLAAPSISSFIPEGIKNLSNNTANLVLEDYEVTLSNANVEDYSNESVKNAVENFNDEESITSVENFVNSLNNDNNALTNNDNVIDVSNYDALMPMFDIVATDGENVSFDMNGELEVSFKAEVAKEMNQEDLVIMQVNPNNGEVEFIQPNDYDASTGEIVATFENLGPFTILKDVSNDDNSANVVSNPTNSDEDDNNNAIAQLKNDMNTPNQNDTNKGLTFINDNNDSPATSDNALFAIPVISLFVASLGIIILKRRSKN